MIGLLALLAADVAHLELLFTANTDGAFADAACDRGPREAGLARLAGEARALPGALVIHAGDVFGPHAFGRFLAREPGGARLAGEWLVRAGFHAFLAGNHELAAGAEALSQLTGALAHGGVRMLGRARAEFQRGGLAISIAGALSPAALRGNAGAPPEPAADALKRQLQGSAGLRIAVAHLGDEAWEPLVRALSGHADLVALNRWPGGGVGVSRLAGAPLVLGIEGAGARLAAVRLVVEDGRVVGAEVRAPPVAAPDPEVAAGLEEVRHAYCARYDRPLGARAEPPLDAPAFLEAALAAVRPPAAADLAFANLDAVDPRAFPLEGPITAADLFAAMPYEEPLAVFDLPGARVRALHAAHRQRVLFLGLAERDGKLLLNGRAVEDGLEYRAVAPEFLVRGGDGVLVPPPVYERLRPAGHTQPPGWRDFLESALSRPPFTEGKPFSAAAFPDPAQHARWTFALGLVASGSDTRIANPPPYPDPRLQRAQVFTAKLEGSARADADSADHGVRAQLLARFGAAALAGQPFAEADDFVRAETLYRFLGLRAALAGAWYAPLPYGSLTAESEFTRPADRAHHRLQGTAAAGLRLQLFSRLELKAGAALRRELLDPAAAASLGVEAGYDLPRFTAARPFGTPVDVESALDAFLGDPGGKNTQELRWRARVSVPIGAAFSVQAGYELFLFTAEGKPWAAASDLTLGLGARLGESLQAY